MDSKNEFLPQKNIYCLTLHNMKEGNKQNQIINIQKSLNCFEAIQIDNASRFVFFKIEE